MSGLDPLAVLAHELRSPVAALVAITDAYPTADDATKRRLRELAGSAVTSIERLLADGSPASLELERVDAGRLVVAVVETAAVGGAPVVADVDEGLLVDADPGRLRQALVNLVSNAVGHSRAGGIVRVSARRRGGDVVLAVSDDGDGVAEGDLTRIFEPGTRLTDARPGSGLGLALVRAIADAHEGTVEVESSPGQGATFRLVLPGASGVG